MELIEREDLLASLNSCFRKTVSGEGHCIFIIGEAGIGKSSLVKTFLREVEDESFQFIGACDSLFTPRPLAPLYDLAFQLKVEWANKIQSDFSRAELFSKFAEEISLKHKPVILVFEDIHWADEATLDFIKFLSRRIARINCLFILTFRDDEIVQQHPLRNVMGELAPDSFTRMILNPFSKEAVQKLADERGYDGENVYKISGGNPFYVNEILASYSRGVPDNIKDAVLSVYNRQVETTKEVWQLLSVIPEGIELNRLSLIAPSWQEAIGNCIEKKILVVENNKVVFKHELYRRTIENSLSPFKRMALNKKLLEILLPTYEQEGEIEKLVHHAKNAGENKLVVQYAPHAAMQAARVGAHIEASKLYLTAIEYFDGKDKDLLVELYEKYAYECYLTSQIREAIIYQTRALKIWKEKNETEKIGNSLRFLSRLWWFEGNRQKAEEFGRQSIEVLEPQPASKSKAMAYSNLSALKMLSDYSKDCLLWGEKAISIARLVGDEETTAHAMNSMGSALMVDEATTQKGIKLLEQSLEISLRNSYHEHASRAYAALGSNGVTIKDYAFAEKVLEKGIKYCEERDLDSMYLYMKGWKSRLFLETGKWDDANNHASCLLKNENLIPVVKIGPLVVKATIKMRKGMPGVLELLNEAKTLAFQTTELQRIIPVILALMEYEWLTGNTYLDMESLEKTINMVVEVEVFSKKSRFYFWLSKVGKDRQHLLEKLEKSGLHNLTPNGEETMLWEKLGCPYEYALTLFEGNIDQKRKALSIIDQLGATAVYEKLKREMRSSGIKKIPRGLRGSTKSNPYQLTNRELDVLRLLKNGIQNKEIARALYISPKTVDHHISSILFKLDVNSRIKAVAQAVHLGILK